MSQPVGPTMRWIATAGLIGWGMFIFVTSCTVIRPQEFFDWVHQHLVSDTELFQRFQEFWGVSWFAVVKSWHALEFAILFRLCLAAVDAVYPTRSSSGNIGWSVIVCSVYAIGDEWHQTFVPDRGGVVSDVLIDCLGTLLAAWFLLLRRRRVLNSPSECRRDPLGGVFRG